MGRDGGLSTCEIAKEGMRPLSSLRLNLIFRDRATAGGGMRTLLLCYGYELWQGGLGMFVTGGWHKSRP